MKLLYRILLLFCKFFNTIMQKLFFTAFLLTFSFASFAQTNWELRTENDDIKIYPSIMPSSKIKALKVEGYFNSTPVQFASVIMDVNTGTEWVYHVKSSTL